MTRTNNRSRFLLTTLAMLLLVLLAVAGQAIAAQDGQEEPKPTAGGSPFHPVFPLLDEAAVNVLESGNPVSTMQTCGACHDATFIVSHSFHADVGLSQFGAPGQVDGGRSWDSSPGLFGRWNALTYRFLSPAGDQVVDLTTPEWLQTIGLRHVGGGPAVYSRDGRPLTELAPDAGNVEASVHGPETGELVAWDWQESGVVEMNCFLCHTANPDNEARTAALQAGQFGWANTATLAGSGLVAAGADGWQWNAGAFDADGNVPEGVLAIQDPTNQNCGSCHGLVHIDARTPLVTQGCSPAQWTTITTGQINSPQKISESGLNLTGKTDLSRSWDVHAERVLGCTDCHYSLNNPIYYQESAATRPDHLLFDPRRIDIGEYLYRPLHQFAKGSSVQSVLAPDLDNTLRRCESCHSIEATHDWLPYKDKHMAVVSCESCHVPELYAPSREYVDWTVLHTDGTPHAGCRGVAEEGPTFGTAVISPYQPVLLPRQEADGSQKLSPFNLLSAWYWVYDESDGQERPVPHEMLAAAWLDGDSYRPEMIAAFDSDNSGQIEEVELEIDTEAKEAAVAGRLAELGLGNPRIAGEVQPYSISHDVAHGDWVTKDCRACHSEDSLVARPVILADRIPGGVSPTLIEGNGFSWPGRIEAGEDGTLFFLPQTKEAGLYILGHNAVEVIDWLGVLMFLGVLLGITVHSGLRYRSARQMAGRQPQPEVREVYMYDVYERLWHWLQTIAILLLIFTGLIIHKPDKFGMFSFSYVVQVHNIVAAILVINAALSLFYHLVSGEIRQYLPRPRGFFDQAIVQAKFYLNGIFKREPHPFEKSRERKLNPLQQLTYFGILNVLLPLQILTGVLMWSAQHWPDIAASLGGLPFLAPFHTLVAWTFASFVVMHVYLTTTGHEPLANIKAMMLGWDEVEVGHAPSTQSAD
jgi:thiosulfate reductase cytochrome b subunit